MNILLITHEGGPAGSTNSIIYLSRGLAERGHNVYVACSVKSLLYKTLENSKAQVVPIEIEKRFDRKAMKQLKQIVKQYDIQVINAQSGYDRYVVGLAKWLYRFKATVIHTRRQMPLTAPGPGIWFYTWTSKKVVAVSQGVKDALVKLGMPKKHVKVIHNGTPKEKYELDNIESKVDGLRKKYDIKPDDRVIGCISRYKKHIQILQAAKLIEEPLIILLVGYEEQPEMKEISDTFTQGHRVIYQPHVPNEEALYYYRLLNAFILPSTTEGLSQALLECMSMGVPSIATNASGNNEMIRNGENGFLFEDTDVETLAKHIETLLRDENLQRQFSEEGKKTVLKDFSIKRVIDDYEAFFESMI